RAVRCAPVALFVRETDAPGTIAPLSSRTTPTMLPVVNSCAQIGELQMNSPANIQATRKEVVRNLVRFIDFSSNWGARAFSLNFCSTLGFASARYKGEI